MSVCSGDDGSLLIRRSSRRMPELLELHSDGCVELLAQFQRDMHDAYQLEHFGEVLQAMGR